MLKICTLICFLFVSGPVYGTLQCARLFPNVETSSKLEKKHLRFMSFNVFNLYLHQGKYVWGEQGLEKAGPNRHPREKAEEHVQGVAKVILELEPDFVFLQEVETEASLNRFNRDYLNSQYDAVMSPTNDPRGIGISFLVKKGLDVDFELKSYQHKKWISPNGQNEPILTRSFPLVKLFRKGEKEPALLVGGVHLKSQRDRKKDPGSKEKRQAELEFVQERLEAMMAMHPQAPAVMMGDFNTSLGGGEVAPIFEHLHMEDPHLSEDHFYDRDGLGRATFTFHQKQDGFEKEAQYLVMDRAFVSRDLMDYMINAEVYRYKHEDSSPKKLPESLDERDLNPSDHYLIYFDISSSISLD